MRRIVQTTALYAALIVMTGSCSGGRPTNYFVREMKIDTEQHLIPVGPKSPRHPDTGSYYMFFHPATQLTIVNHFTWQGGSGDVRELLYLEADRDVLERTVKDDQIVTGPFGAIVVEKQCFYNRPVATYWSSIQVLLQSAHPDIGREIPDPVPAVPANVPPLTSISIVRIFRAGPQLVFGSGNYEANGTLGSIQSGKIMNGDVQHPAPITMAPGPRSSQMWPRFNEIRQASGLPPRIEVEKYLRLKRLPLLNASNPEERTIVVLVYGFGQLVRQDSLDNGVVTSSRYVRPVVTEEKGILGPECDARFRQQESAGISTLQ
jgi:hypothetical protein